MSVTDDFRKAAEQALESALSEAEQMRSERGDIIMAEAAGFRRGIEAAALVCDDYERDGELRQQYACEVADELAARIRALLPEDRT